MLSNGMLLSQLYASNFNKLLIAGNSQISQLLKPLHENTSTHKPEKLLYQLKPQVRPVKVDNEIHLRIPRIEISFDDLGSRHHMH